MKGKFTYLLLFCLAIGFTSKAITTKIQFINNSADAALSTIDIYVNNLLLVDNLNFREGTALIDVTATTPINIGIATGMSGTVIDTFKNFTVTLSNLNDYVGVINGIKSTSGYSPATPVSLDIYTGVRKNALGAFDVDVLFMNGVTDGQAMDLRTGTKIMANDVSYRSYGTYFSMPCTDVVTRFTNTSGSAIIKSHNATFQSNAMVGKGVLVIASGFANPASNSNGPARGLWAATTDGGALMEFTTTDAEALARYQLIHNGADTTADTVDVYFDAVKQYDDFKFRNATAFTDAYAKTSFTISIAPRTSSSVTDAYYTLPVTLDSASKNILVIDGIKSPGGYNPSQPFMIHKYSSAMEEAGNSSNTDALFLNGSTDASSTTISEIPSTTWFSSVPYGNFSSSYYSRATADVILKMVNGSNTSYYSANYSTLNWAGQAITILASGFTDSTVNNKGPKLGLWAATAGGGALIKLPPTTVGINQLPSAKNAIFVYPVPANNSLHIYTGGKAVQSAMVLDINGKLIHQFNTITNNEININTLATGSYLLQVSLDNSSGPTTIRFSKQ